MNRAEVPTLGARSWLFDRRWWERCVLVVLAAVVAYQVFADPIVGTADNRDWWRVTKQLGIGYLPSPGPDATFFKNVQREYALVHKENVQYLTSEMLFGRAALVLNRVFASQGRFDLRWMGFVHAAGYLAAIAVFLAAFRRRGWRARLLVGVFALVTLSDVRIVAYFNSFYCENAQIIFLIAALGFALMAADESRNARQRTLFYGGFVATAILFFFAKTQDLVFAFPFAVIAYWIAPPHLGGRLARVIIATSLIALFVWGMKSDAYAVTNHVNTLVTVGEEILPHSKTPEKDLQELGDGDPNKVTFGRIALFYVKHPHRWWNVSKRRLHQAFTHLPLGNFEPARTVTGDSNPYAESKTFDLFSGWKDRNYPRSLWFWIAMACAYVAVLATKYRQGTASDRTLAVVNLMLLAGCVLQFIAVVTFEANGTEKHFFIFNVLVDFVLLLSAFEAVRLVRLVRNRM